MSALWCIVEVLAQGRVFAQPGLLCCGFVIVGGGV